LTLYNESRERVLDVAESLFVQQGYAAVKLRHIAQALQVKESSLYYHFRDGKEEIYIAVMHRNLDRHRHGIQAAIQEAGDDWVNQLRYVAYWLLSQVPFDMMRLSKSDLPAINPHAAHDIDEVAYTALNLPIRQVLENAVRQDEANIPDCDLVAGIFIAMVSAIHIIKSEWNTKTKQAMADTLIEAWVNGLKRR
jgi:AcrR family transcriptional regulator